ncbi:endolytic transglycosylase MltG [Candidatus Saccharibacteria bacterium]|nr:endolytic transglycosylase MltG [Candidatus Saccharibacteria bacterium]
MKIVGLDVGTRRIGVATADTNVRIAVPKTTVVVNNGFEFAEIARIARANNTNWFVLGMPRSNEGNKTAQSRYVREFANSLKNAIPGAKIRFQDESLTSVEAEKRLKSRKKGYKKEEIDAEAATIILQDFIESMSNTVNSSTKPAKDEIDEIVPVEEKKEGNSMLKKLVIFLLIVIAALGIGGGVAFAWYNSALGAVYDIDCSASGKEDARCEYIDFTVKSGDTLNVIADNLEAVDLVRSSFVFQIYMRSQGQSEQIKIGDYQFRRNMTVAQIATQLVEGAKNPNVFSFTILPGSTIREVKQDLLKTELYTEAEINAAFAKDYRGTSTEIDKLLQNWPASNAYGAEPLEGYLFGDTYEFYKTDSVEKIITTAMKALWEVVEGNDLVAKFAAHNLNLYQGITLASIVQRESGTTGQATVAQIFYSRLSQNIMLGSDVTTQYAVDLVDPERKTYTNNYLALEIDSPYNTRKNLGLTPGPICNPGVSALLAVANPADTSYLYFLTGDDGVMYYSYTEDEHNRNIVEHCQQLCNVSL